MGQEPLDPVDAFVARNAQFRAELHPDQQAWMDELVRRARAYSRAARQGPHQDKEKPVLFALVIEASRELETRYANLRELRANVDELLRVLCEADLMRLGVQGPGRGQSRLPGPWRPQDGQTRLTAPGSVSKPNRH